MLDLSCTIWPENTPEEVAQRQYVSRTITAARAHAAELGYKVDEFFLPRQSEHSVKRILRARGIRGIVIGGIGHTTALKLNLDLADFAVAAVSSTLLTPRLHRTGHDHFNGMQIALRHLTELGYRKIAFVVGREQEEILNRKYIGSFLAHHPLGHAAALGLLRVVTMAGAGEIASALRELRPDCLLLTYTPTPLPLQRGKPVPLVSLDLLLENPVLAGIYQQPGWRPQRRWILSSSKSTKENVASRQNEKICSPTDAGSTTRAARRESLA